MESALFLITFLTAVCVSTHHKIHRVCLVKSQCVLSSVDYETLRTTGVVLAVVMFVSGILIALSKFRLPPTNHLKIAASSHITEHFDLVTVICRSSNR